MADTNTDSPAAGKQTAGQMVTAIGPTLARLAADTQTDHACGPSRGAATA